ncbi:MAG: hypothetical protein U0586_16215 [Candidatus Brocadiaceae bacterium]
MKKFVGLFTFIIAILFVISTASASLNDRRVAYYPFNGNAIDESRNGHSLSTLKFILE